jgi:hypothetical protein
MDLEIIVIDAMDIGIYTLEKQIEAAIDISCVVDKIIEELRKSK